MISALSDQAEIIIKCHVGRQSDTNSRNIRPIRTLPKTFLSEKSDLSDFPKMQRISNDVKQLTVKIDKLYDKIFMASPGNP